MYPPTEAELAQEREHCVEVEHTGSRIPRTYCNVTVKENDRRAAELEQQMEMQRLQRSSSFQVNQD